MQIPNHSRLIMSIFKDTSSIFEDRFQSTLMITCIHLVRVYNLIRNHITEVKCRNWNFPSLHRVLFWYNFKNSKYHWQLYVSISFPWMHTVEFLSKDKVKLCAILQHAYNCIGIRSIWVKNKDIKLMMMVRKFDTVKEYILAYCYYWLVRYMVIFYLKLIIWNSWAGYFSGCLASLCLNVFFFFLHTGEPFYVDVDIKILGIESSSVW